MENKKIAAYICVALLLVVIFSLLITADKETEYIIEDNKKFTFNEYRKTQGKLEFKHSNENKNTPETKKQGTETDTDTNMTIVNVNQLFLGHMISPYTLKYFKFLDGQFKDSKNMEDHLEKVRQFLLEQLPEKQANALFDIYKKYLKTEIDLVKEIQIRGDFNMSDPDKAIEMLRFAHEYRRSMIGDDIADALYGSELKVNEYTIRRASIVNDNSLYGLEKERMLGELNKDMWGDEADDVESYPNDFNRYQEKLVIYQKDINDIENEDDRKQKIQEIRKQLFTPDIVERLENVDQQLEEESQKEISYQESINDIINNKALSQEEKDKQIVQLQQETFGDQADAFRRRETIQKEREKLIQSHKQ